MLRSLKELLGYKVESKDNEKPGKVRDFLLDDREWKLKYLVTDAGGWLRGRRVLVPAGALGEATPEEKVVTVSLEEEQIESQPSLSADEPMSRQHKVNVYLKDDDVEIALEVDNAVAVEVNRVP